MRLGLALAICLPILSGCVMTEVGVTNPVVGLTTVAVAPFFNLSQERAVDGRRFALAYYAELQKTPGFQVIPVGVVEQAMFDNRLEMNNPDDVLKLSQLLGADAVVIGAVTDYSPYYPPRVGLQVSWYSPRPWSFYPGIPTDEWARHYAKPHRFSLFKPCRVEDSCLACPPEGAPPTAPGSVPASLPAAAAPVVTRGQSLDDAAPILRGSRVRNLPEFFDEGDEGETQQTQAIQGISPQFAPRMLGASATPGPMVVAPSQGVPMNLDGAPPLAGSPVIDPTFDPRVPLMSYTRLFDGADPKVTARLRDYVELQGDLRSGGWQACLQRSEDFIRFTSHVMIVEMLQLHGGEAKKRVVLKVRKYR